TRNTVTLNWTTATELNNFGFEIQRLTIENVWEKIVFVEGYGTTTETHNYSYVDANLTPGKYLYRLKQIDFNGQYEYSDIIEVELIPEQYALFQNYPNPFNPTTILKYQILELSFITLTVYDVKGNEIATLVNKEKPAGSYAVEFNATGLPSGIYFYKLQAGNFVEIKKLVLMK
ncbi:MAG: T9SS type A sorting domain-containing protein, partial [Bacteroidetes bacterium]|nr:T9SS type A sorting domain-containing protein [Bacteroidota bacterium]